VSNEGSFLVEDFINAITTQLDRVQDSLRLKAVNRPLTYALKDISLDLQVFVEVDAQGNVKFRSSGPNETGASIIKLGFTTITRPMIEENTVSLAMTRSPRLDELGLEDEERKQLEQLGVRNVAQLQKLGQSTGNSTVSRLTGISAERLKKALAFGRPQVTQVTPQKPPAQILPIRQPPIKQPREPFAPPVVKPQLPIVQPIRQANPIFAEPIKVARGTKHLNLFGNNLIGEDGVSKVRLNNKVLNITDADENVLVVEMPENHESGALEIVLPDGQQILYELSFADEAEDYGYEPVSRSVPNAQAKDFWEPDREY
jgi:hypothetical protein